MFNLVKRGVEFKMNWLNWSIPISPGFQFQFNSNSKPFNSIPIQFMLNWIELIINSNSIHELIRALDSVLHLESHICSIKSTCCQNNPAKSLFFLSWMHLHQFQYLSVVPQVLHCPFVVVSQSPWQWVGWELPGYFRLIFSHLYNEVYFNNGVMHEINVTD